MTIFEYAIPFVFLVVATFVWLMRDNTQWKLMNDRPFRFKFFFF